ncbi:tryptophan-rich sensory protein [Tateyamaria sp. ANG-S1]|uniref:tryptophan-rich sensory protein n=1 Tax=Tateyamaria sp. ANG-S1 TaxID=1577905 RepID=UPI00057EFB70|nr:tryptophan-rich sensory protein [Tateyamaria sp. ANG-S1]KIC51113.1 seryl-tRNA synthetase [Tateyamaria sp. ANG-S1]
MPLLVLILAVTFAASPFWVPDFGGFESDQFPIPQNDPPVQPAGYAFAIWGPIYLWLIVGAAFGVLKRWSTPDWAPVRAPLAVSLAVGSVWLPVAVQSAVWATILIWVMLISALVALWRSPRLEPWVAAWPVGLYAGWLSAASCVALGLMLAGYGFTSKQTAAWVMVTAAVVLALVIQRALGRAPTYGIAVIWALVAIGVQNGFDLRSVGALAVVGALVMLRPTISALRGEDLSPRGQR